MAFSSPANKKHHLFGQVEYIFRATVVLDFVRISVNNGGCLPHFGCDFGVIGLPAIVG